MTTTQTTNAAAQPACQSGDCPRQAMGTTGWCKYHMLFPTERADAKGRRAGPVGENLDNAIADELSDFD